jgi:membrane-associated phospholipid phosphatase
MPRRAVQALSGAAFAVILLFLTWFLAFHISAFQRADANILSGFAGLHHRPRVDPIAAFIADLCNPNPYVYFAGALVLLALARRRPGVALAIAAILFGANATAQLLKPLLAAPRPVLPGGHQINAASWPSGHATAAMSLALCAVLAAPARLRGAVAALGAAFAVAVSYSFLTLEWHYPSDVFGGFLIAAAWTLLGIAAVITVRSRRSHASRAQQVERVPLREALGPAAVGLGGAALLAGAVALARPHQVIVYAEAHTTFMVGAAAIAAMGLAVATGVMLALRR